MVTLPTVGEYDRSIHESLSKYSPIFSHYVGLTQKDSQSFSDEIRKKKHTDWLKCALATYTDAESPEHVCRYWSQQTDKLIKEVWSHLQIPEDYVSLLLYGKLGSRELNLSSDIDIVFVKNNGFDDPFVQSKIKQFIKLLNDNTPFGFAYRVDLNLRPGGDHSPLVPDKNNFYNFYDEYLEAWHRLSFIRMRPLFAGTALSDDLLSYCKKRCFPKRLVLEEIKNVRSKIAFQWRKSQEPFDIKLHPGGIRDIELYIHSLQVIYGGRNPSLQVPQITEAIKALRVVDALQEEEANYLLDFYWRLRKIENLIHIKGDQHTYLLQNSFFTELPSLGFTVAEISQGFEKAGQYIGGFFTKSHQETVETNVKPQDLSKNSLKAIEEIKSLKSTSIKKQKIESLKDEILQSYINKAHEIAIDEDLAIQIFKDFIFSIKSKTSIFYLLGRQKELLDTLAWMFSISPYVGNILTRRPELTDSFALGQVVFEEDDDIETLWQCLVDYKLLGQLMGIVEFFKNPSSNELFFNLSQQADLIVQKLLKFLVKDLKSAPLEVLALGKWSGKELGVRSDLDFVFLSEMNPTPEQMKVARRMITLLTTQSNAGRLYDIDLRLKPNENAGPLILHKKSFFHFIENQAETWQKQAYLRSRICGETGFYLKDHFSSLKITEQDLKSLNIIHKRLIQPTTDNQIDIKSCPGGLIQTEFAIQKKVLLGDQVPESSSTQSLLSTIDIEQDIADQIYKNYLFLRRLEQTFQITNDSSSTKVGAQSNNLSRVSKLLGVQSVFQTLQNTIIEQQQLLKNLDLNH